MLDKVQVQDAGDMNVVRELFREYEHGLGISLCFQGFEEELETLPGRYAPPDGRLLVARTGEGVAGCIGVRKLDDETCEMKRLYVRDNFRGLGIGNLLIERAFAEARRIGYRRMRLDTLPGLMAKAVSLYESHGFQRIPAYYDNPDPDALFMEKEL